MLIPTLNLLAQTLPAAAPSKDNSTILGFFCIGVFVAIVASLAYLLGKQRSLPKERHCPKCNAPQRGEFCPVCGTKF